MSWTAVSVYEVAKAPHFSLMLMCFFWAFITLPGAPQGTSSKMLSHPSLILLGVQSSLVFMKHIHLDRISQSNTQGWGCHVTGLGRSKRELGPCPHRVHQRVGTPRSAMALTDCPRQGQPFQPLIFHLKVWPCPWYWGTSLPPLRNFLPSEVTAGHSQWLLWMPPLGTQCLHFTGNLDLTNFIIKRSWHDSGRAGRSLFHCGALR